MLKILTFVLFVISLALLLTRAEMKDTLNVEQSILMIVIQSILNDPEFLALNNDQQLRVLTIIYKMLEDRFKSQKKKRDVSSQNILLEDLTNA